LIRMVSELHRLGYQRLRIMPYEYPLAWRLGIGPAEIFSQTNGAYVETYELEQLAVYSSASETSYFQWTDAHTDNARQLAEKFLLRFPSLCERAKGRDWAYAGWLSELLGVLEKERALPVVMEEYGQPPTELRALPLRRYGANEGDRAFDLPPLGHRPEPLIMAIDARRPTMPRLRDVGPLKDLTQFGTVASLVGVAMAVGVQIFEQRDEDAGHELLVPIARALAGNDDAYIINDEWCALGALGSALTVGLDLPLNFIPDRTLEEVVLFGLEHISLGVRHILQHTEAASDWDGVTGPRLMEVHAFSTCVFLGTAPILYPGQTLERFLSQVTNPLADNIR
jgi:hypothetical protein